MNNKVKWSVISVSIIMGLTFGGIVMNNEKAAGNAIFDRKIDWLHENLSALNKEGFEENEYSDDASCLETSITILVWEIMR